MASPTDTRPFEANGRRVVDPPNTHCYVAILPPEILAQVFLDAKALSAVLAASSIRFRCDWKERSWLNVAGVCRTWRDIALSTPRLWCSFDISRLDSVQEMLTRSKNAPLRIRCKAGPFEARQHNSIAKEIMLRVTMVEELNLSSSASDLTELFNPLDSIPLTSLPLLRTLRLVARRDCTGFFSFSRLASKQLPALRILELHNTTLTSPLPPLPQLIRLRLSSQNTDHAISIPFLLHILQHAPKLEDLSLSCAISNPPGEYTLSKVVSGSLKNVFIKAADLQCSLLFKYLVFPASAIVRFESSRSSLPPSQDVSGLVVLCSRYRREGAPAIDSIRISSSGAPPHYLSITLYSCSADPLCKIHIVSEEPMLHLTDLCMELCEALPSSAITTLRLDGLEGFHLSTWSGLLRNFGLVRHVEASYTLTPLLHALLGTCHPSHSHTVLFPRLLTLDLRCCNFGALTLARNPNVGDMLPTMLRLIQQRKDCGTAAPTIKIQQCQITAVEVAEIAKCTEVDWDGDELLG